ncbi:MAG: ribulose-phosphate 3-epimerase [Chthoniobacterales bacterium]|nr:ribulose-phosphate 3-epimerase [Chthoniobacterales bacterium]
MSNKLAPSILAADFANLGNQVKAVVEAGADRIHIDVMDGHFVPNLSMGEPIVRSLRPVTKLPFEVHLMITNPDLFLEEFAAAGADTFIIHYEGNNNLHRTVQKAKLLGKKIGVAINPATPASLLETILPELDLVLIMTVNPGFGSQHFLPLTLPKITQVQAMLHHQSLHAEIEVDGGIDATTILMAHQAGATVFVAGTSIFKSPLGITRAMEQLSTSLTS